MQLNFMKFEDRRAGFASIRCDCGEEFFDAGAVAETWIT